MKIRIFTFSLILIFLFVFLIFYKGLQNSNIYKPNANIEMNIPNFEAKLLLNNKVISSKEIFKDDDFFLMNIWASWCVPCRDEHRFLMNLSKQEKIEIIGLNYKDNIKNAQSFLSELGNPYEIVFLDIDGTISIEWGAFGVPETFLIHNKKIIKKVIGPINENTLIEIESLIK